MSFFYKREGFTLIELLVVIAVIGILSTIGFLTFRPEKSTVTFDILVSDFKQGFEGASLNSRSGVKHSGKHVKGFGVYISKAQGENTTLTIFADCDGDGRYYDVLQNPNRKPAVAVCASENISEIHFQKGFFLDSLGDCIKDGTSTKSACDDLSVVFLPPHGVVKFTPNNDNTDDFDIDGLDAMGFAGFTLGHEEGNRYSIKINKRGIIRED